MIRIVTRVAPFHSTLPGTRVHHTDDSCPDAQDALFLDVEQGTGGLPECDRCVALAALRRVAQPDAD